MTLEELNTFVTTQANVSMEAYYWWCTAFMVIIHVGFLMYEVGATRMKNAVSSGVKNLLAFAFMIPTFWLFGWYIYLAFPAGFVPIDLEGYGEFYNPYIDQVQLAEFKIQNMPIGRDIESTPYGYLIN